MLKFSKRYCSFLLVLVFAVLAQGCATRYSASPITMQVVDSLSKQPIPGVHVVVHWRVTFGGHGSNMDVMALEAVTDANGRFTFSAWRQEAPPDLPAFARPDTFGPEIILFSPGYKWNAFSNRDPRPDGARYTFLSEWDGKTTELTRLSDNDPHLSNKMSGVLTGVNLNGCKFRRIPKMLSALEKEGRRLKSMGIITDLPDRREYEAAIGIEKCGSLDDIFGKK